MFNRLLTSSDLVHFQREATQEAVIFYPFHYDCYCSRWCCHKLVKLFLSTLFIQTNTLNYFLFFCAAVFLVNAWLNAENAVQFNFWCSEWNTNAYIHLSLHSRDLLNARLSLLLSFVLSRSVCLFVTISLCSCVSQNQAKQKRQTSVTHFMPICIVRDSNYRNPQLQCNNSKTVKKPHQITSFVTQNNGLGEIFGFIFECVSHRGWRWRSTTAHGIIKEIIY